MGVSGHHFGFSLHTLDYQDLELCTSIYGLLCSPLEKWADSFTYFSTVFFLIDYNGVIHSDISASQFRWVSNIFSQCVVCLFTLMKPFNKKFSVFIEKTLAMFRSGYRFHVMFFLKKIPLYLKVVKIFFCGIFEVFLLLHFKVWSLNMCDWILLLIM